MRSLAWVLLIGGGVALLHFSAFDVKFTLSLGMVFVIAGLVGLFKTLF
jgi:hypothetical protein